MKKIIIVALFLFLNPVLKAQEYLHYQWRGFDQGFYCDDTLLNCAINHYAIDTARNTMWLIGNFLGADTVSSPGIVGYKNNQFVKFNGLSAPTSTGNDYLIYNGKLAVCSKTTVYLLDMDTPTFTIIGTFPTSAYSGGVCLAEYNGDLYVGGQFNAIKGPTGGWVTTYCIARWDGTNWNQLNGLLLNGGPYVCDMVVYQGKLIVGGLFDSAGGVNAWNIAAWNGANWSHLWTGTGGYGTNNTSNTHYARVRDMEVFQNNLYIIGDIDSVCGIPTHLAYWNGTNWTGTSYPLHGILFKSFLNHLIVFTNENNLQVDWWENNQQIPVDSGFDQNQVGAMETFNDTLFLSGSILSSGNTPTFRIARLIYDSSINVSIGEIINNLVNEITVFPNPMSDEVTVTSNLMMEEIHVIDITGREILQIKTQTRKGKINLSYLTSGIYFLSVKTSEGISNVKVMKE